MIDMWIALAAVAGLVLLVDLATTLLRKRARHIPVPHGLAQKEIESDV